jgi:hypothetical protein
VYGDSLTSQSSPPTRLQFTALSQRNVLVPSSSAHHRTPNPSLQPCTTRPIQPTTPHARILFPEIQTARLLEGVCPSSIEFTAFANFGILAGRFSNPIVEHDSPGRGPGLPVAWPFAIYPQLPISTVNLCRNNCPHVQTLFSYLYKNRSCGLGDLDHIEIVRGKAQ